MKSMKHNVDDVLCGLQDHVKNDNQFGAVRVPSGSRALSEFRFESGAFLRDADALAPTTGSMVWTHRYGKVPTVPTIEGQRRW